MRKYFRILMIFIISLVIMGCSNKESTDTIEGETYKTIIEVNCEENWILSKYDIEILIEEKTIAKFEHGGKETYDLELTEGEHTFKVIKTDDSDVKGVSKFIVSGETKLKYDLTCYNDEISIYARNEITPPYTPSELGELTYSEVKKAFETAGFTDIEEKVIKDLEENQLDLEYIVTSIKIGDSKKFTEKDKFMCDNKVIIEYHLRKDIILDIDSYDLHGKHYSEVEKLLRDKGFENIELEVSTNLPLFGNVEDGEVYEVYINGINFDEGDGRSPTDKVKIKYYEVKNKADGKLTRETAKRTFEDFGEYQYPYGFKCHWFLDLINEEQYDDGSWYFKVGVTIKNAYGEKYDTVAEGIVYGTEIDSKVKDFYISK